MGTQGEAGRYNGKVAVITGGSSGIGLAVARRFLASGMSVAIGARGEERLNQAAATLAEEAGAERVLAVPTDVANEVQVARLVDETVAKFGGVDYLLNNAGIFDLGNIETMEPEAWNRVIQVNTVGAYMAARACWPHMKQRGGGYIFNLSSVAGKEGFADASAYSASKFALVGLSESLREEGVPHNIKVSVLCPGFVDTPMVADAPVPAEEMIRPQDLAETCMYLLGLSTFASVAEIVMGRMVE